ncbi:MAG TPA: DUF1361 domain-containing protein, partial [Patescibacteria group bacterium]|nr:DUF1361 domain-containing protein [Patescibacteria group bacterium]
MLTRKRWSSWEALILTILWLIFLPNSFYMISDFVHLEYLNQSSIIYDTLMLTSFIYNGVVLGFASLYLIHLQLKKRLSRVPATSLIALTLFISSVAVYFGRNLRLSSFNVFTNPGGLLFNITNSVFHIHSYPDLFTLVITTFLLLCSMY